MARTKRKPVYLNETSATGVTITADSLDSVNDWNAWFAKFWVFIDNHAWIKGFNYINQDWENTGYPGWGDARIQNSPFVTQWYKQEMRRPKFIHARSLPTGVSDVAKQPVETALLQNYPNPFNPNTSFEFRVPGSRLVALRVYDLLGREVATLVNGNVEAGSHTVRFNAAGLPSGVYYYRLSVTPAASRDLGPASRNGQPGDFVATKKFVVLR
jgi:hypothetical protein